MTQAENECGYGSQRVPGIGPIMGSRHNLILSEKDTKEV